MSWRRLRVLIQHLPPESYTMTAIRLATPAEDPERREAADPEAGRWSQLEMLVAQIIDALRRQEYYFLQANGAKRLDRPVPVPRPGVTPRKKTAVLSDEGADVLFQLINGGKEAG